MASFLFIRQTMKPVRIYGMVIKNGAGLYNINAVLGMLRGYQN